jgi:hypothetical protein
MVSAVVLPYYFEFKTHLTLKGGVSGKKIWMKLESSKYVLQEFNIVVYTLHVYLVIWLTIVPEVCNI